MPAIKNPHIRVKYPADGSFLRWGATILIVVLVMLFEFYLFSRYSLWYNRAETTDNKIQVGSSDVPPDHKVYSSPSPSPEAVPMISAVPDSHEFHPVIPTQSPRAKEPVSTESGESVTIVYRESMNLMPGVDFSTVLRGILELETKSEYLLSPEREAALYKSCTQILKVWNNSELRKEETEKCKYLFFASLNRKQMEFVGKNMESWTKDPGRYKAKSGQDQEEYLLKQCVELLSERVQKTVE